MSFLWALACGSVLGLAARIILFVATVLAWVARNLDQPALRMWGIATSGSPTTAHQLTAARWTR